VSPLDECPYPVPHVRALARGWRPLPKVRHAVTPAFRAALEAWFSPDPWERDAPGEGLVTTDEGYRCYACGAESPYIERPMVGRWWEQPDHDANAPHNSVCLWVEARAVLAAP
jgi:hypothetical protein